MLHDYDNILTNLQTVAYAVDFRSDTFKNSLMILYHWLVACTRYKAGQRPGFILRTVRRREQL